MVKQLLKKYLTNEKIGESQADIISFKHQWNGKVVEYSKYFE